MEHVCGSTAADTNARVQMLPNLGDVFPAAWALLQQLLVQYTAQVLQRCDTPLEEVIDEQGQVCTIETTISNLLSVMKGKSISPSKLC